MNLEPRIEAALQHVLSDEVLAGTPPGLIEAVRHGVFPGGARVRPKLCLAVATACGAEQLELAESAACAVELLHCASLVHDDMPCFDDSKLRRGKPSVHAQFGKSLALLAGDALIVHAFNALALAPGDHPERLPVVLALVAQGVGMPVGIVSGQAWECEPEIPVEQYRRAKTGALFAAATMSGAAAAGSDPALWRALGEYIGEAYQVADDLLDFAGDAEVMGKPAGRDAALNRPNAVAEMGPHEAAVVLRQLVDKAMDSIPACPGEVALRQLLADESEQFVRQALNCRAAA